MPDRHSDSVDSASGTTVDLSSTPVGVEAEPGTEIYTDSEFDPAAAQLYSESYFVVLAPGVAEEILTAAELYDRLAMMLARLPESDLPRDLAVIAKPDDRLRHLIDTTCELELEDGNFLQWYAIRLEKNS